MVGEQIGFDEGGVLEALRDPVYTRTETKYRHNKAGLVTSEITTVTNVTGAHLVAASLGPALLALFIGFADSEPTKEDYAALLAGTFFGVGGMSLAALFAIWGPEEDPDVPPTDDDDPARPWGKGTNVIQEWIDKVFG